MDVDRVGNWKNFSQHMSTGRNPHPILQKTDQNPLAFWQFRQLFVVSSTDYKDIPIPNRANSSSDGR